MQNLLKTKGLPCFSMRMNLCLFLHSKIQYLGIKTRSERKVNDDLKKKGEQPDEIERKLRSWNGWSHGREEPRRRSETKQQQEWWARDQLESVKPRMPRTPPLPQAETRVKMVEIFTKLLFSLSSLFSLSFLAFVHYNEKSNLIMTLWWGGTRPWGDVLAAVVVVGGGCDGDDCCCWCVSTVWGWENDMKVRDCRSQSSQVERSATEHVLRQLVQ